MAITVTMPQMGESVVEGTVERWLVREGERVDKDQTLCEVSTDKVDAEIPAPSAGVVTRILAPEGETIEVGAELAEIDPAAATVEAPETGEPAETVEAAAPAPGAAAPPTEAVRASPVARRLAEEHGVDLAEIAPGEDRRITRDDVLAHLDRGPASAEPVPAARPAAAESTRQDREVPETLGDFLSRLRIPTYRPREEDRVLPFTAIRRRIAEHMVVSKIVSPHVGTVAEADMQRIVGLRERTKAEFERVHGFKLTYLPFVVHATVRGLRDFPRMNATVVGESVVERSGVHIGVAVETERGLVVPVVRDADHLSLVGLARAIEDLAARARDRQITADELQGGTFTITNPGREGNLYGFAVINQPQVGILRMGELKKRPVVVERDGEDALIVRPMMYLALSYDHRVIDGATGNGFLYRVARYLEEADFEI